MSTITPQIEISSDHGVHIFDWPTVPRVGDYVDLGIPGHAGDRAEIVRYVVWSDDGITVDCDCVEYPSAIAGSAEVVS